MVGDFVIVLVGFYLVILLLGFGFFGLFVDYCVFGLIVFCLLVDCVFLAVLLFYG